MLNRRNFGLLAGTSVVGLKFGNMAANAQSTPDASMLTTTLTPFGSERAGNADGTIPAWTGGYTTLPAGWTSGNAMPDLFANEQPIVVIDSSNMAQYTEKLSDGVMATMTKFGLSIKVYPTHRTAAATQEVYDNIARNVARATLDPAGPQLGYSNAFGGVPFPLPDISNPLIAGAQIVWNHRGRWSGHAYSFRSIGCVVNNGELNMSDIAPSQFDFPYYRKSGSPADFNGIQYKQYTTLTGPANLVGQEIVAWYSTNNYRQPDIAWEVLSGQGRVRKAPELTFDTPSSFADGQANYDEYFGFLGSLEKYDWRYLEKKELYIPYNNNAIYQPPAEEVHKDHFLDPDLVRWELHRVWVVEATLRPGERNVLARRRYYIDEDTWTIGVGDTWDANGNLFHVDTNYNNHRPDLPGTVYGNNAILNMQTGDYATIAGPWNEKASPTLVYVDSFPDSIFDPQNMVASSQY